MIPVAISYSGGTSSEWMIEAIIRGVIPRPNPVAVFFADTGEEHEWTYRHVDEVEARCKAAGLYFDRCKHPRYSLGDHVLHAVASGATRVDSPPFWIAKDGGGKGRVIQCCTKEFKTAVLRRRQAGWLAALGRKKRLITWIGYAHDEQHRATKAVAKRGVKWETLDFPGIRYGRTRAMQREELIAWTGRAPKFSMCVCCPFKTAPRWAATKGADLARAIQIDDAIRDPSQFGLTEGEGFLHQDLIPVSSLLSRPQADDTDETPIDACDAGGCFL